MVALDSTLVPDAIGGFELGPLVGQGSMLEVHAAHHRQLAWSAVCKKPRRQGDAEAAARLGREAAALVATNHPALPRLLFYDAEHAVLVEEELAGAPLCRVLDGHDTLDGGQLMAVIVGVGDALAALHRAGFAHGHLEARHILRVNGAVRLTSVGKNGQIDAAQGDDQRALGDLAERLRDAAHVVVAPSVRAAIARARSGGYAEVADFVTALRAPADTLHLGSASRPSPRAVAIAAVKTVALPPGAELGSRYALPPPARLPLARRRVPARRSNLPTLGWMILGATVGTLLMTCLWLAAR